MRIIEPFRSVEVLLRCCMMKSSRYQTPGDVQSIVDPSALLSRQESGASIHNVITPIYRNVRQIEAHAPEVLLDDVREMTWH